MGEWSHEFLEAVQGRCARVAVSASAARRQGASGVVAAARKHLTHAALREFGTSEPAEFRACLDEATAKLQRRLPSGARHWGLARKLLNIFLRDALYTAYLRDEFHLDRAEALFELPLDSITAGRLREAAGNAVPRWLGVRHLTPADSDEFQAAALECAAGRRIARVHLDAFWWSNRDARPQGARA